MKIQIDQSGKIEDTSKDTILAFANNKFYSIKIPRRIKRQLQEIFRRGGKAKLFIYRTFAVGIFLLIKKHLKELSVIIIDKEYPGHENLIIDIILELLEKEKIKKIPNIYFGRIGKKSKAHLFAYKVFKKKLKVNETISFERIEKLAIKKDRASR